MDCPSSESLMNTLALINTNMRLFYINLCCRNICGPTICLRAWEKRSQNLLGSHERKGSPVCSLSVFGQEMLRLLRRLGKDLFTGERAKSRKWRCQQPFRANHMTMMLRVMFAACLSPGALQLCLPVLTQERRRGSGAFARVAPGPWNRWRL